MKGTASQGAENSVSVLTTKSSSERSASQIYRVTQRLMARSRRTPTVLILPIAARGFSTTEARSLGPFTVFPDNAKAGSSKEAQPRSHDPSEFDPVLGLRWLKSSERHWVRCTPSGSFDCAPPSAVSRDKSVSAPLRMTILW